ncbi:MDR family MFS transporter [Neobacillus cucumis]|uniref:MDR family MFS transporter n=1 Tax=Neobacillus cucumis TaxID=1740721 RepID=UPI002E1DF69A|nr:MDR family MFS transporter [Neobacillus cucumis]
MKNRLSVLICIVVGMLIASLDSTIMNTTMPIITKELGGYSLYAWSFASYMIISTVTAPIYGRLSDMFGRKKIFGLSIILFIIGSILCGTSQSMIQLVIYRALQGIGAGGIIPLAVIIAGDLFPVEQRGKIQALFTGMWGLSAVLAPALGSIFVIYLSWRWIFYVNIPLGIIAILFLLPYQETYVPKKSKIDFIGALLFSIGIIALLLTTVLKSNLLLSGVIGVLFLVLFFIYERKQASPIIPLGIFKNHEVRDLNINILFVCAGTFGISNFIPLFMKNVIHTSTFASGAVLLGTSVGWMIGAVPAGKTYLKYGLRKPLVLCAFMELIGTGLLFLLGNHTNFWFIFITLAISGYGFGLGIALSTIGAQEAVEGHQKGIATSLINFSRNVGTSIGITIMGTIATKSNNLLVNFPQVVWYAVIVGIFALVMSLFVKEKNLNHYQQKTAQG